MQEAAERLGQLTRPEDPAHPGKCRAQRQRQPSGPGKAHKPGAGGHPETGDGRGEDQLLNLRTGTIRGMKKGENI